MIRKAEQSDIGKMLDIWLRASIKAHAFMDKEFWESKVGDMRETYLPAADNYVYCDSSGTLVGFLSLCGNNLAALFVAPDRQGQGIGTALLDKAKTLSPVLTLTVYKENTRSTAFYLKHGFRTVREQPDPHSGRAELLMSFTA